MLVVTMWWWMGMEGGLELGDPAEGEELTAQLTHSYAVSFKPASHFLAALALLDLTPVTRYPVSWKDYLSFRLQTRV